MHPDDLQGTLAFLRGAERLKTVTRSGWTSAGEPESVAEHTWRLCLLALVLGPRFEGGYCQTFGCDQAATSGVDVCPGTNSTCAQRGGPDEPISSCYEKCTATGAACSRASVGYRCESIDTVAPPSVCLVNSGT